ncbi:hypothetical protein WJX73_004458, partial [Symbiochloris irregularis]
GWPDANGKVPKSYNPHVLHQNKTAGSETGIAAWNGPSGAGQLLDKPDATASPSMQAAKSQDPSAQAGMAAEVTQQPAGADAGSDGAVQQQADDQSLAACAGAVSSPASTKGKRPRQAEPSTDSTKRSKPSRLSQNPITATPRAAYTKKNGIWEGPAEIYAQPETQLSFNLPDGYSVINRQVYRQGDVRLADYLDADEDGDYEVDEIVHQKTYRKKVQLRVKWMGYELNPDEWIEQALLKHLDVWKDWHKQDSHPDPRGRNVMHTD